MYHIGTIIRRSGRKNHWGCNSEMEYWKWSVGGHLTIPFPIIQKLFTLLQNSLPLVSLYNDSINFNQGDISDSKHQKTPHMILLHPIPLPRAAFKYPDSNPTIAQAAHMYILHIPSVFNPQHRNGQTPPNQDRRSPTRHSRLACPSLHTIRRRLNSHQTNGLQPFACILWPPVGCIKWVFPSRKCANSIFPICKSIRKQRIHTISWHYSDDAVPPYFCGSLGTSRS
jgi:hypothetical protein